MYNYRVMMRLPKVYSGSVQLMVCVAFDQFNVVIDM
jgi:hypothetical protein